MATNDQIQASIDKRLDDFSAKLTVFLDDLQVQATADPFTVFPSPSIGSSFIIQTGDAGGSFNDALNDQPDRPTGLDYVPPVDPGPAPGDFTLADVSLPTIPVFADVPPTLTFPVQPEFDLPVQPSAPTIDTVTLPAKPTVTLPSVPVLKDVVLPEAPTLTLPTFSESFPVTPDITLLTDTFSYNEPEYQNDLLDRIEATLFADLANGGFGVTTSDEEAIYSRAVDRETRLGNAKERELIDSYAQRAWRAPTGALAQIVDANIRETLGAISTANREMAISRADLMRKAREFAISQGITLNELLLRDFGFRQERVLNAARFAAEFGISVFDAKIRQHNLKLAAFEAFTRSYEVQIRALLSQTEIYKSQVEAASVQQEINESVVDVYEAQIRAATTLISLYETELNAAQVQATLEKLKIEQFQVQMQAFVATVQAKSEEVRLFESFIRAEGIKQDVYQSQVRAFAVRVDAAKSEADIELARLNADVRTAELELTGYEAQLRKYVADIDAEVKRVAAKAEVYGTDIEAFRAILSGWEGLSRVDIAASEAFTREAQEEARINLEQLRVRLSEIIQQKELRLGAAEAGGDAFGKTVAALGNSLQSIAVNEQDIVGT